MNFIPLGKPDLMGSRNASEGISFAELSFDLFSDPENPTSPDTPESSIELEDPFSFKEVFDLALRAGELREVASFIVLGSATADAVSREYLAIFSCLLFLLFFYCFSGRILACVLLNVSIEKSWRTKMQVLVL